MRNVLLVMVLCTPAACGEFDVLLARLGSEEVAEREAAEAELDRLGFRAERAIRAWLYAGELEAETRARLERAASRLARLRLAASRIDLVERFPHPCGHAKSIAWSPDGTVLAVAGDLLSFRDADGRWKLVDARAFAVAPGRGGSEIVGLTEEGLMAWDGRDGRPVACLSEVASTDHAKLSMDGAGRWAAFLGEGRLAVSGTGADTWEAWVLDLAWSRDGRLAVACDASVAPGEESGIEVRDGHGRRLAWTETDSRPRAVAWDPEGRFIVWGRCRDLHVCDPGTLEDLEVRDIGARWISILDGAALTMVGREATFWHLPDWEPVCSRILGEADIDAAALSPSKDRLAVASGGRIQVHNIDLRLTPEIR